MLNNKTFTECLTSNHHFNFHFRNFAAADAVAHSQPALKHPAVSVFLMILSSGYRIIMFAELNFSKHQIFIGFETFGTSKPWGNADIHQKRIQFAVISGNSNFNLCEKLFILKKFT